MLSPMPKHDFLGSEMLGKLPVSFGRHLGRVKIMLSRRPEDDFLGSEMLGEFSGGLRETPRTLKNHVLAYARV